MNRISGDVSIRFQHPNKELDFFSSLLGFPCFRSWTAGSPRQTPTGEPLAGTYNESYWVSRLDFVSQDGFAEQLAVVMDRLVTARKHLQAFRLSGGKIEIYLQLPGSVNNGDTIDSMLLKTMGELGIDLLIEVFPGMK